MKISLSLSSVFLTVASVQALPPIEARDGIPNPGEDCVYHWPGHNKVYSGTVTTTNDCKGGVSFWQYGKDADVQCCVRESCTAFSDPDGEYGQYSCLNTYKTEECGDGHGEFVAGHCLGDSTVQCCHAQLTYVSPTTYNNGGRYEGLSRTREDQSNNQRTDGVVVPSYPTNNREGDGNGFVVTSYPANGREDDRNGIVVPSYPTNDKARGAENGEISSQPSSEENTPSTYGQQPDGSVVVPTKPQAPETLREGLSSWRIIPNGST